MNTRRIFRTFLFLLLGLALLVVTFFVVVASFFGEEIKAQVVQRINANLSAPASASEIRFEPWKQFPRMSIALSNVVLLGNPQSGAPNDTLLRAQSVYFNFNPLRAIWGQISVNQCVVEDAAIFLYRPSSGQANYNVWQADSTKANGAVSLKLNQVVLVRTDLRIDDLHSDWRMDLEAREVRAAVDLTDTVSWPISGELDVFVHTLAVGKTTYLHELPLNGNAELALLNKGGQVELSEASLKVNELPLQGSGEYRSADSYRFVASARGSLDALARLSPALPKMPRGYHAEGRGEVEALLYRQPGQTISAEVRFEIDGGEFVQDSTALKLRDITAQGTYFYRQGAADRLELVSSSTSLGYGKLAVNGLITNLSAPDVDLAVKGNIDLQRASAFFQWQQVDSLTGELRMDGRLSGTFSKSAEKWAFRQRIVTGRIEVRDAHVLIPGSRKLLHLKSGSLQLDNERATLQHVEGSMGSSDWSINGTARRLLPWLLSEGETLELEAKFTGNRLDLNELLSENPQAADTSYRVVLPGKIAAELNMKVDELVFRQFRASNFSCRMFLSNARLTLDPLTFQTCDGNFVCDALFVQPTGRDISVQSNIRVTDVNIRKLFMAFENFGQDVIRAENIDGTLQADGIFSTRMSNQLKLDPKKAQSLFDVRVDRGTLVGVTALRQVANYIKSNPLLAGGVDLPALSANLERLEFEELNNQIKIQNEQVVIPDMEVRSNALNFRASGTHSFSNQVDYRLNFRLAELLTRKKNTRSEFGEVADDGTGMTIFMAMKGPAANPEFSLDKEGMRERRRENIEREKDTLKEILREELSIFRKKDKSDSTAKPPNPDAVNTPAEQIDDKGKKPRKKKSNDDEILDALEEDDDF